MSVDHARIILYREGCCCSLQLASPTSSTSTSATILPSKAVGLYVLVRLLFNVFGITDDLLLLLRWSGGITMVVGALLALGQWNIKRLFAYSSVSQVGLIVLAFGFGTTAGIVGALFHLVNHAVFKPLLFFNSGAIELAAGTRDLRKMRGLSKRIPVTAATCMVGSLSISGIPPFNGFWSKLIIVVAGVNAGFTGWACLVVLTSIATLAYQFKVQTAAFFGSDTPSPEVAVSHDAESVFMVAPMIILAIGCGALSLFTLTGLDEPFLVASAAKVLIKGVFTW